MLLIYSTAMQRSVRLASHLKVSKRVNLICTVTFQVLAHAPEGSTAVTHMSTVLAVRFLDE